ncbi:hypothetical protein [Streptomyces inhibens]|uniref:hypothetical protein n=1 Tax=Streptomyces inhibens TaxID=2293571 RepID=UPI001EE6A8CB|nr:hypothetical protein [Streptomyces inhibens]UKY52447.1 hypothetical protein KI385_29010 [Streptomyces inhibens]
MSTDTPEGAGAERERPPARRPQQRKQVLLRLDPLIHDALTRWADDELRSANAQIEFLLRKALSDAGRLPRGAGAIPRRGRPPKAKDPDGDQDGQGGQGARSD